MTGVRLGLRGERQPVVLVQGLAPEPLLLFGHSIRIRVKKSNRIEIGAQQVIVQFSGVRLIDSPSRLVEALQGQFGHGEIGIGIDEFRIKLQESAGCFGSFLVLTQLLIQQGQYVVCVYVAGMDLG